VSDHPIRPAFHSPTSPESSALCILVDSCAMRAMRAALLFVRSVRALPVLSRSSVLARAPSRFVSTEASVPATPLSKHIEQFVPTAAILTLLISIAGVAAYFNGELMSLKKAIEGTAGKLEERMAGTAGKLEERVAGIIKEVDAKNTGTKDAVIKEVDAKIIGFEKAADLKVRFLLRARARTIDPLTHPLPLPLTVQEQVTGSSPSPSPSPTSPPIAHAVFVVVGCCISGIGCCAETKVKHWFKFTCTGGVGGSSRAMVLDESGRGSWTRGERGRGLHPPCSERTSSVISAALAKLN
jgi:hypothetical protein